MSDECMSNLAPTMSLSRFRYQRSRHGKRLTSFLSTTLSKASAEASPLHHPLSSSKVYSCGLFGVRLHGCGT
ncbi:hypothetical protein FA13DRAFT_1736481 [Coprinellus micaceus]|uniref:Uncharacterized protein n=1 Tax=Coprinellus micaceus TaxID=71717 RepID=A0A4Y7SZS1_COPMI|nr:hypothetical protein FA13DRAFT_1736481 [Coprinellus micaceus]